MEISNTRKRPQDNKKPSTNHRQQLEQRRRTTMNACLWLQLQSSFQSSAIIVVFKASSLWMSQRCRTGSKFI